MGVKIIKLTDKTTKRLVGNDPLLAQKVRNKVNSEMVNPTNKWAQDMHPVVGSHGEAQHPSLLQNEIISKFFK